MVKNTKGGKGSKFLARKFNTNTASSNTFRLPMNEYEQFGVVTHFFGNAANVVYSADLLTIKTMIRGKFKGRYKRDSIIAPGKIVLIGLREFEKPNYKFADIIEVYDANEHNLILQSAHSSLIISLLNSFSSSSTTAIQQNDILFQTNMEEETDMNGNLLSGEDNVKMSSSSKNDKTETILYNNEIIDIDDI
jgi:hypothetical protein